MMKIQWCKCKKCDRIVAARAYKGDWLNAIYPKTHKVNGVKCEGVYSDVDTFTDNKAELSKEGGSK